jgi:hypothetical protein
VGVCRIERIVERQHRHRMAHLAELLRRRRTNIQRWAIFSNQIRKPRFDRSIANAKLVVLGVWNFGRVFAV